MPEDVSLRDYIDTKINGVEEKIGDFKKFVAQHFELDDKAKCLANESILTRLETMNDFRAQINKERSDYVTREMLATHLENVDKRLKALEMAKAFSAGKAYAVVALFAAIPTIIALIALFTG